MLVEVAPVLDPPVERKPKRYVPPGPVTRWGTPVWSADPPLAKRPPWREAEDGLRLHIWLLAGLYGRTGQ